jgi:hypothetical protein
MVIVGGRVVVHVSAMIIIMPIIVIIGTTVGVVSAMRKFVATIMVRVLYIAPASSALGDNPRMVGSFHLDALMAVQGVMNVHPVAGVDISWRAIGPGVDFPAICGMHYL